ncbi:MAG: hypothetical protein HY677_01600 [Chloroflexi bacterium]|nr:hypothetical protein [Chloroflexota bacterium]
MIKRPILLLLVALLGFFVVQAGFAGHTALAAGPIEVISNTYKADFPKGVTFHLEARSSTDINKVTLFYDVKGHGSSAYGRPEFTPGKQVQLDFKLDTGGNMYIPPTTELSYRWQIEDAAGNTLQTDPIPFAYDDGRFAWQKLTQDNVTLYWYQGGNAYGQQLLDMVLEGVSRLAWLHQDGTLQPVRIVVYANKPTMDSALPVRSQAYSEQIITLGTVVSPQIMILLGQQSGLEETVFHELSHMVLQQIYRSPYGNIPSWLDEGLAVNNQTSLGNGYESAFRSAVARDKLISLRSLTSQSGDPNEVTLWYGEAGSVVKYMLNSGGKPKMVEYLRTITSGNQYEAAMKKVYGYDLDGLEARFRESLGLPPRQPVAKPTTPQEAKPTPAPAQEPPAVPTASGAGQTKGGGSFPTALVAGIFAFLVVAALAVTGAVVLLIRRR